MARPVFADLYRPIKSLLNDNYHGDKFKFDIKTKANNGLAIGVAADNDKSGLNGTLNFSKAVGKVNVSGKVDAKGKVSLNYAANKIAEGAKVAASIELPTSGAEVKTAGKATISGDYRTPNFTVTAETTSTTSTHTLVSSATVLYQNFAVGGSVDVEAYPGKSLNKFEYGVAYTDEKFLFAAQTEDSNKNVKLGYIHRLDNNLTVGGEFKFGLTEGVKTGVFAVGTDYKVDSDSTLKFKVDSKGVVAASYGINLNKNARATISGEANTSKLANGVKIGLNIGYTA